MKHFKYIVFLFCITVNAQQLAFPSALGAGSYATGGRGGAVIHVTTLNWTGAGSLKAALQTTGARTIVFDVSGEIDATIENDYTTIITGAGYDNLTIAGQTAPNGGITIRTSCFSFNNVDNVIVRNIRFRGGGGGVDQDALWMVNCNNIIFDHCTFSHGRDEAASFSGSSGAMTGVTVQNCFFQDSKTGTILGVDGVYGEFSLINNVYSNISHRFSNTKGIGRYDLINNVVYNWKERLSRFQEGGAQNLINNYYKASYQGLRLSGWFGSGSTKVRQHKIAVFTSDVTPISDYPVVYTTGSIIEVERPTPQVDDSNTFTAFFGSNAVAENANVPAKYFTATQYALLGQTFTPKTAAQTYTDVLADVGANKTLNGDGSINAYQDTKDAADILMIQNDTYSGAFYTAISSIPYPTIPINTRAGTYDTDGDGMADTWETATFGNLSRTGTLDFDADGYTDLEEFLNLVDSGAVTPPTGNINYTLSDRQKRTSKRIIKNKLIRI